MSQSADDFGAGETLSLKRRSSLAASRGGAAHEYLLMAMLHLATFGALLWLYLDGIVPVFSFDGYTQTFHGVLTAVTPAKLFIAAGLAFLLPFTVPVSKRPSTLFLHIILALTLVPSLVLYAAADLPHEFIIISVAAFLIVCLISHLPALRMGETFAIGSRTMLLVTVILTFLFVVSFTAFGGLRYLNFDVRRVYEFRTEAYENLPAIYGYFISMVTKALIPFVMVLACVHRAVWLALVMALCSVLLFALTANKAPLFIPLMVLYVYYFYPLGRISAWFVFGVFCAAIVSNLAIQLFLVAGSQLGVWTGAILGNRTLLMPSLINYAYYDQFIDGARYWWSESRLTFGLVPMPFPEISTNLIGIKYFGSAETFANTGWIGSGFAQAGVLGVVLYSVGVGLIFLVIDGIARKYGPRVTVAMFVILVLIMITSSDFVSMFLTHGMLLGLLLARFTDGDGIRGALDR